MWQSETYDPETIDRELNYAQNLGMRVARTFLHCLIWQQNLTEFKKILDNFLSIANNRKIKVMFVLFDDCWVNVSNLGP